MRYNSYRSQSVDGALVERSPASEIRSSQVSDRGTDRGLRSVCETLTYEQKQIMNDE